MLLLTQTHPNFFHLLLLHSCEPTHLTIQNVFLKTVVSRCYQESSKLAQYLLLRAFAVLIASTRAAFARTIADVAAPHSLVRGLRRLRHCDRVGGSRSCRRRVSSTWQWQRGFEG